MAHGISGWIVSFIMLIVLMRIAAKIIFDYIRMGWKNDIMRQRNRKERLGIQEGNLLL